MIQRIQSVYLFLTAVVGAVISFDNPHLWRAKLVNNTYQYFDGQSDYLYFMLLMIIIVLSLVAIFLFKKRKVQFRLTLINLLFSLGLVAVQYLKITALSQQLKDAGMLASSTYLPGAFLPIILVILLFLAARGIYKDERLVKSLDRLR
jgi:uncharacterized membrane protein YhaH (DUF805 family)